MDDPDHHLALYRLLDWNNQARPAPIDLAPLHSPFLDRHPPFISMLAFLNAYNIDVARFAQGGQAPPQAHLRKKLCQRIAHMIRAAANSPKQQQLLMVDSLYQNVKKYLPQSVASKQISLINETAESEKIRPRARPTTANTSSFAQQTRLEIDTSTRLRRPLTGTTRHSSTTRPARPQTGVPRASQPYESILETEMQQCQVSRIQSPSEYEQVSMIERFTAQKEDYVAGRRTVHSNMEVPSIRVSAYKPRYNKQQEFSGELFLDQQQMSSQDLPKKKQILIEEPRHSAGPGEQHNVSAVAIEGLEQHIQSALAGFSDPLQQQAADQEAGGGQAADDEQGQPQLQTEPKKDKLAPRAKPYLLDRKEVIQQRGKYLQLYQETRSIVKRRFEREQIIGMQQQHCRKRARVQSQSSRKRQGGLQFTRYGDKPAQAQQMWGNFAQKDAARVKVKRILEAEAKYVQPLPPQEKLNMTELDPTALLTKHAPSRRRPFSLIMAEAEATAREEEIEQALKSKASISRRAKFCRVGSIERGLRRERGAGQQSGSVSISGLGLLSNPFFPKKKKKGGKKKGKK